MTADDKDSKGTPDGQAERGIVDRDDDDFADFDEFLIDDEDDDGPDDDADREPDPGFAAFADDFDDPLADWPGADDSGEDAAAGPETTDGEPQWLLPEEDDQDLASAARELSDGLTALDDGGQDWGVHGAQEDDEVAGGEEAAAPDGDSGDSGDDGRDADSGSDDPAWHELEPADDVAPPQTATGAEESTGADEAAGASANTDRAATDGDTGAATGAPTVHATASIEPYTPSAQAGEEPIVEQPAAEEPPVDMLPGGAVAGDEAPVADEPWLDEPDVDEPPADQAEVDESTAGAAVDDEDGADATERDWAEETLFADDEIVDDFLDDLDMPETEPASGMDDRLAAAGTIAAAAGLSGAASAPGTPGAAPPTRDTTGIEKAAQRAQLDEGRASAEAPPPAAVDGDEERGLPIAMIAVIVAALVLLGLGGYGVIQQRQAMQAEIRELQARLATTMSTEESATIRERQRGLEVDNERLVADMQSLRGELTTLRERAVELASENAGLEELNASLRDDNATLKARVDELESNVASRAAAAAEARQQAVAASRAAAGAPRAAAGAPAPAAAAAAGWFVNFGSYAQRAIAQEWADRLEVSRGTVTVQSASSGGRTLYRVRVVGLASREDAEWVAVRLERKFDLPKLWIGTQ